MEPARILTDRRFLWWRLGTLALLIQGLLCEIAAAGEPLWQVGPVPETLRESLGLASFYQKHIAVGGFPIVGSEKVSDNALREAAWIVRHVVGDRDDIHAGSNASEYWAEAVQDWFDDNRENDSLHNHVDTRSELKEYDPRLAELVAEVLGDGPWRYQKPVHREAAGRSHLVDFDPAKSPRFRWRKAPVVPKPRVLIQTPLGDIEVELDAERAPITTRNFLRYTLAGFYADGSFYRTVTLANQVDDDVKIEVIQASADPAREDDFFPPISLERTRDTGLLHVDGVISMARDEPDTAQDQFFICIGDQPELDVGGKRHPDGQGFAAFGRVIRGMDVVRKIHELPAEGQQLASPVLIQRAIRTR
jgi:peptidyl-prolyl cis-trans isomerase A (cyclophilin A)